MTLASSAQLLDRAAEISAAVSQDPTTDALQAAALIDLWNAGTGRNSLDRSISMLDMAANSDPASASILSDLAAAHLARASTWQDAREVLLALDASSRALQLDSLHVAALTNRFFALQQLSLFTQAEHGARRLLQLDSTSMWAADARTWLANRNHLAAESILKDSTDAGELQRYSRRQPERALSLAWEQLLPVWGAAFTKGDTSRASTALTQAQIIGEALEKRGEPSTADAVRAIHAANPHSRHQLAHGHIAYGESQRLRTTNQYLSADSVLGAWTDPERTSPALSLWNAYARATNWLSLRRTDDAARGLGSLLDQVTATQYPALIGRTQWVSSLIQLRVGQNASGLRGIGEARRIFEQLGFGEYVAWTTGIEGEVAVQAADNATGMNRLVRALDGFATAPQSTGRHNVLFVLATAVSRTGLPYAAMAIQDEDAAMSGQSPSPITRAEAELSRVRLLASMNTVRELAAGIDRAKRAIASIPDSGMRRQLHYELGVVRGRSLLATNASEAWAILDSSVRMLAPTGNPEKLLPALLGRAYASASLNRDADADDDLRTAVGMYIEKADNMRNSRATGAERIALEAQRDAWVQQSRPVFDTLISHTLERGGPEAAATSLALFERWRAGLSTATPPATGQAEGKQARVSNAARTIIVASVANQLVTWTSAGASIAVRTVPMPRDSLERLTERTRLALERNDRRSYMTTLARMYQLLIRPVNSALGDTGSTVSFVLDQALANVPLAALYDEQTQAYLIQRHAVRISGPFVAQREPWPTDPQTFRSSSRLLVVESPDYDRSMYPALLALAGAREEARTVASQYPAVVTLSGPVADSATVSRALARATVLHYAGHAVFDESQPLRSSLAMLPHGLSATAISSLSLGQLNLVVLSACETGRSAIRRGLGFGELSSAFIAAGARGVVGSLWRTDDDATARLMITFHKVYSRSGNAARALRSAQLDQLQDSPNVWAAFRYVGQ